MHKQCRVARELIGWKQNHLSEKSGISIGTIADFERGVRELRVSTLEKLINTFEKAGSLGSAAILCCKAKLCKLITSLTTNPHLFFGK